MWFRISAGRDRKLVGLDCGVGWSVIVACGGGCGDVGCLREMSLYSFLEEAIEMCDQVCL